MPNRGIYSVTVPGVVKGWEMFAAGSAPCHSPTFSRPRSSTPRTDSPSRMSSRVHGRELRPSFPPGPTRRKIFLPNGRAPHAGEIFKNPALAGRSTDRRKRRRRILRRQDGRRDSRVERELGGTMTAADLKEFQPEWVEPISTTYRGWTVSELPPNTQGIAALMMLNIMEQYPARRVRPHEHQGDARDDRGEEARLRRHAALRG